MGFLATDGGIANRKGRAVFRLAPSSFSPVNIPSLSLWVSADSGVTTISSSFVSYIEIYNASVSTSNGEYFRNSGGYEIFYNVDDNGNSIYYEEETDQWYLYDALLDSNTYYCPDVNNEEGWYFTGGPGTADASYSYTSLNNGVVNVVSQTTTPVNFSGVGSPVISATTINGKPTFDFTTGGKLVGPSISQAKTVYAVVRPTSFPSSYSCIIECSGGGLYTAISGSVWGAYWSTETFPTGLGSLLTPNNNHIVGVIRGAGTSTTFRRNGAALTTSVNGGASFARASTTIGNDSGGGQPAKALVAEVLAFSDTLTSEQIGQVEAYLNQKYAVY